MTFAEAAKVALIIGTADGGCFNCARSLVNLANDMFPQFRWSVLQRDAELRYSDTWEFADTDNTNWERGTAMVVRVGVEDVR